MRRKCFGKGVEEVWMDHGFAICTATHPSQPNRNGKSRGRKIHLARNGKVTLCNMLVDEHLPDNDRNWSMVSNGKCGTCFNENRIKNVRKQEEKYELD